MGTDGGLFGPDSITWRVHADPTYAVAGLRGLLLQALHPLAMAAVEQNGGFEADPWGRLTRTSQYIATTTFGTEVEALRAAARVRRHPPEAARDDPRPAGVPPRPPRTSCYGSIAAKWIRCCRPRSAVGSG